MKNLSIIEELKSFKSKNYLSFFMPGHSQLKYKSDFTDVQKEVFAILKDFEKDIFSFDVTEVCDFDNLANPSGIIQKSQEIVSKSFLAKKSHFLVNGSTIGVLAMICAVTEYKEKIIIQKNSHKSVYNACKLNNLEIVCINSKKDEKYDIYEKINLYEFEKLAEKNKDAKAVVITSPDYYGQDQDIKSLAQIAQRYGMYLLIDCAHGAHYNYSSDFGEFALNNGADMAVTSFHKTLPSLNQTSVLFLNKRVDDETCNKVQEYINIFQTTSPSYIFLSNIELANNIMTKYGKKLYDDLKRFIDEFKSKIYGLNYVKLLENDDFSRIVLSFEDERVNYIQPYLKEEYKILPEMVNEKSIVLICNIFHTKSDFEKLFKALEEIEHLFFKRKVKKNHSFSEKRLKKEKILDYLRQSLGEKSEKTIYSYPPGTPVIIKDEIITNKHIDYLKNIIKNDDIDLIV